MQIQCTNRVVMVPPEYFSFNNQTAATNAFQQHAVEEAQARQLAMHEFETMIEQLRAHHIDVLVLPNKTNVITPDAVFPNNWFSLHHEAGCTTLVLYPMLTPNRRAERQSAALLSLFSAHGITIDSIIDLTYLEQKQQILEGTGSLVLDRVQHLAFAALSPRTEKNAVYEFAKALNYKPIIFHSYDQHDIAIYHTNVMMNIGSQFAVINLESIRDKKEKARVKATLIKAGKDIIAIDQQQTQAMAANILQLRNDDNQSKIILSHTAYQAFSDKQRQQLQKYGELVIVTIDTIEHLGGGSARCMLAEIFYQ